MSGLQFGLNIKKKGPVLAKPKPAASRPLGGRSAFGNRSSDEDNLDDDEDTTTTTPSSFSRPNPTTSSSSTASVNKALRPYATAAVQSTAVIEQQNAALAEDPTIFDYDGVYDQLKAADRARELARKQDSADRKPKYVAALLQAAETRKRDRLLAEERRLEREREKEGEEFKDKDMFITPAYKAQKEAMRLEEEADRKREETLAKDKDGSLMQGFYRSLLDERTKLRPSGADLMAAQSMIAGDTKALKVLEEEKKSEELEVRERAKEAQARGIKVAVNDEGEVINKRELLKGGLNIIKKKPTATSSSSSTLDRGSRDRYDREREYAAYKDAKYRSSSSRHGRDDRDDASKDQRARMTEQIEHQLLEQQKKEEEEERKRQEAIREALKRKNQDDQVMDAKARYLARKAATATAGKTGS
ncbi:coiled-coil domain-containing protein 55-domain containing protein [Gamsiella multidivaricata]|uniref:coiled-coil domain-containing protein 55-domain containing protein n=1 Tax=Gamsiella multidivaricata TaxID=101098 RepID=UPI00221F862C|nr:coiled-coil domain-containing protein 55-domain containing protein [Gamsiella multidivaricata]KAI7827010.1 coiled-coil domain-containing protein 55-domain containing protein [Gamsiella multidivaricata]